MLVIQDVLMHGTKHPQLFHFSSDTSGRTVTRQITEFMVFSSLNCI